MGDNVSPPVITKGNHQTHEVKQRAAQHPSFKHRPLKGGRVMMMVESHHNKDNTDKSVMSFKSVLQDLDTASLLPLYNIL